MGDFLPTDITGNRHKANAHSAAANERVEPAKDVMRRKIYDWARAFGSFTLKDVCRAFDKLPNQVSGRLSEMKALGMVKETGESRERCAVLSVTQGETKRMNECTKCGKPVMWLKHKMSGKPAPIECDAHAQGNILVKGEQYRIATNDEIEKAREIGHPLYINHFAKCPNAADFRKGK